MLPDRVSNPGPLTYESGVLPFALRGPAYFRKVSVSDIDSRKVDRFRNSRYFMTNPNI